MDIQFGVSHFLAESDGVIRSVTLLLLALSATSWYVIAGRILAQVRLARGLKPALAAFWEADGEQQGIAALAADTSGIARKLAEAAFETAHAHQRSVGRKLGAGLTVDEAVGRALRQELIQGQAQLEYGLTFLASVGSTAPFIGLFGTVWGIYHALVGLAGSKQVVLDKVAGPVGEALIVTAAGLFVAIPAVLAYNAFTRTNRLTLAQLEGFAHDLHAYLTLGEKRKSRS
jgi:biopolymer transport protein ExbB